MKKIDFIINIVITMLFIAIAVGCFGAFFWGWKFHLILLGVMSGYAGGTMIAGTVDEIRDYNKK